MFLVPVLPFAYRQRLCAGESTCTCVRLQVADGELDPATLQSAAQDAEQAEQAIEQADSKDKPPESPKNSDTHESEDDDAAAEDSTSEKEEAGTNSPGMDNA